MRRQSLTLERIAAELQEPEEPLQDCIRCSCPFSASFEGIICPDCVEKEDAELDTH